MSVVRSFTGYRPSPRFDEQPWTQARLDEATDFEGPWTEVEVFALDPVDEDPEVPQSREFTTELASDDATWFRFAFLDAEGDQEITEPVSLRGDAIPQTRIVELSDFRPSRRHDEKPWTAARIEQADRVDSADWSAVETIEFDAIDADPKKPCVRNFSVGGVSLEWVRIVFLDADGNTDEPTAPAATLGPQFRPTADQVAGILSARTYSDGGEVGGDEAAAEQQRYFTGDTHPTLDDVEQRLIPAACDDVSLEAGRIPGIYLAEARRVAALRAAAEVERSYIPEQAEDRRTIYQTLRLTYEAEVKMLARSIEMWLFATRGLL